MSRLFASRPYKYMMLFLLLQILFGEVGADGDGSGAGGNAVCTYGFAQKGALVCVTAFAKSVIHIADNDCDEVCNMYE